MTSGQWQSTGHVQEVPGNVDRIPDYDPRSGDHLWTMLTMHRIDPTKMDGRDGPPLLDQENLLSIQGPGCYYCEQAYTPRLLRRRCPGQP